jgi:hypothetical protein
VAFERFAAFTVAGAVPELFRNGTHRLPDYPEERKLNGHLKL